jgi:alpha-N-arabinofuranosidase
VNGWLGGCIRVGDYYSDQYRGKKAGWTGKNDVIYGTPTYYMMKMYANREIDYLLDSHVECDVYSVHAAAKKTDRKMDNLPVIDAVSCIHERK